MIPSVFEIPSLQLSRCCRYIYIYTHQHDTDHGLEEINKQLARSASIMAKNFTRICLEHFNKVLHTAGALIR